MNYVVKIEDGILMARVAGHHTIWMYRAPRSSSVEEKPGLYLLVDDRGYCCYVGETDKFKTRMCSHESTDKFCWWTHSIYFWDEAPHSAFSSTDDRRWYEKKLKEAIEIRHPTFTKMVQNKPKPESGDEVLNEMLALLDVIGFDVDSASPLSSSVPLTTQAETLSGNESHFPYQVGKVVQAVFDFLQNDPRMTAKSIDAFCAPESSAKFKTGGWPVLKKRTNNSEETKDEQGRQRYYAKLPLTFSGKHFWLTSQFAPHGIEPVLAWLREIGLYENEVLRICKKKWG